MIARTFTRARTTKGTIVYAEDLGEQPIAIPALYIRKEAGLNAEKLTLVVGVPAEFERNES
jgi:hypothetical protein